MVALFGSGSQSNLIEEYLVNKILLEVHYHHNPYPLRWVNKDVALKVMK
jgi:hypothetical protein